MEFRNDIQGLRAIAVLMVFIFHLSSSILPGGFIGVDLFFVISGYLISSIVLYKLQNKSFSLLDFYYGRVNRIVPAYLTMLIIVGLCAVVIFAPSDVTELRRGLFWSTIFNSNNYFATLDNYFGATSSENPLLHTWTLAVEMQFYLVLPILLMFIKHKKTLILTILTFMLISLVYGTYGVVSNNKGVMYYSLFARCCEFLVGVLATLLSVRDSAYVKKHSLLLSSTGISIIFISAFLIDESSRFPGILAMVPCAGALMILVSSNNLINDILGNRHLVFTGEISYSVYLWHWPVMGFLRYYYDIYEFSLGQKFIVIILTLTVSLVSYYYIETAFRGRRGIKFWAPFAILSAGIVILVGSIRLMNKQVLDLPSEYISPTFGLSSHGYSFKSIETFGDTLRSNPKILLIGDSHALSVKKSLDIIGTRNHFSFKTVTNDKYPTIPGLTQNEIRELRNYEQYKKLIVEVNKLISETEIIILQFSGSGELWTPAIKSLADNLKQHQTFILLSDFAHLDKNPVRVNRSIVKNPKKSYNFKRNTEPINEEILALINANPKCHYFDLTNSPAFDDAPFYSDTLMYYDANHLNLYGSKVYADKIERSFMKRFNALTKK